MVSLKKHKTSCWDLLSEKTHNTSLTEKQKDLTREHCDHSRSHTGTGSQQEERWEFPVLVPVFAP